MKGLIHGVSVEQRKEPGVKYLELPCWWMCLPAEFHLQLVFVLTDAPSLLNHLASLSWALKPTQSASQSPLPFILLVSSNSPLLFILCVHTCVTNVCMCTPVYNCPVFMECFLNLILHQFWGVNFCNFFSLFLWSQSCLLLQYSQTLNFLQFPTPLSKLLPLSLFFFFFSPFLIVVVSSTSIL